MLIILKQIKKKKNEQNYCRINKIGRSWKKNKIVKKKLKKIIYSIFIKSSKVKYTWKFEINETKHIIELFNAKLSGKKRILHNSKEVFS